MCNVIVLMSRSNGDEWKPVLRTEIKKRGVKANQLAAVAAPVAIENTFMKMENWKIDEKYSDPTTSGIAIRLSFSLGCLHEYSNIK